MEQNGKTKKRTKNNLFILLKDNRGDLIFCAICLIITNMIFYGIRYFCHPAATFAKGFLIFWLFYLAVIGMEIFITLKTITKSRLVYIIPAGWILLFIVFVLLTVTSSNVCAAKTYADRITVNELDVSAIPEIEDISKIPLMATDSAKVLGDKVLGNLSDVVSQYSVSNTYTTICYKGYVYKVAPLEWNGFFKWKSNETIPGYVLINTETSEANFVRLTEGMTISPSGYFGDNLERFLQSEYPNSLLGDYTFQLDEEGNPYWICSVLENQTVLGCTKPIEVIILNAVTRESKKIPISEAPEWIDCIYTGERALGLYNGYGLYQNGYWNSVFSQKGCTVATDDYGYIVKDNDLYIYTGVTSVASDSSNLGFLLINSRTTDSASESAAIKAAEGEVQNYGYKASFPALVNINGSPTYVMVLKDDTGLVKKYACVNAKQYAIVVVNDTLPTTIAAYKKVITNGVDISEETKIIEGVISDIKFVNVEGNTFCYISLIDDNNVYKISFSEDLLLLHSEDKVNIKVSSLIDNNSSQIISINSINK